MKIKFLAVLLISALFATAQEKKDITLEDAILKSRSTLGPEGRLDIKMIPGSGNYVYLSSDYQALIAGSKSGKEDTIAKVSEINGKITDAKLSHLYGVKWINSSSFYFFAKNNLFVYDYKKNEAKKISTLSENAGNKKLSATSKNVAFTVDNNVWVVQENQAPVVVTAFKDKNMVAGQAIARSEFGITEGLFWSNSGNGLAFYQKDETDVAEYPLLDINETPGKLKNIKYPMAGQGSEKSTVGIYNLATNNLVYIKSPIEEKDHYYTNLSWSADDAHVLMAEVNRDQNHAWLNMYNAQTGAFEKTLWEETHEAWVEPEIPAYFINNKECVWVSEKDGFMNLYLINIESDKTKQITANKFETLSIIGHSKNEIYFTGPGSTPTEMHAFKVSKNGGKVTQLTKESGYHSVRFSNDFKYFIDSYSNITTPKVVSLKSGKSGAILKTIVKAENPLEDYNIGEVTISTIKSADGVTDLYTRMIKPSHFDPNKKYPVLVYLYGGTHAQMVTNRWLGGAPMWMYYQAEKGYIIYTVDNRGSGHRGFEFENVIHRNLGDNEMADQLKGVDYLKSLPYVNADKMAIHGWSYGGFMTTSMMLRNPGVFKVGVAGGPVTDWKYYEVMYGERYMDRPEQNVEGYKKARLMEYVNNLEGDLLLIHGTIDNVVVMQHNLALVKAFVDAGIQVDFFPYPMHEHNVGGKDRIHLMRKVLDYIDDKLDLE